VWNNTIIGYAEPGRKGWVGYDTYKGILSVHSISEKDARDKRERERGVRWGIKITHYANKVKPAIENTYIYI